MENLRWVPKLLCGIYRTGPTWKDQNLGRNVEVIYMDEPCKCLLGSSHFIVWSTRSSDAVKLCPTRKKIDISLFFYFLLCRREKNKNKNVLTQFYARREKKIDISLFFYFLLCRREKNKNKNVLTQFFFLVGDNFS